MSTAVSLRRRENVCDFCSDPNPISMFRSEAVISPSFADIPDLAQGKWWACESCSKLIEHENWNALADRATAILCCRIERDDAQAEQKRRTTRSGVLKLHSLFRRYRR